MAMASQPGFFLSFEGSEGCGKSTQIRILVDRLRAAGHDPVLLREPGGTALGEQIRHLLQHSEDGRAMCPETEVLLFAASRAQLVREKILPALAAGRIVICDRFLDSTTVYQGAARRLPPDDVARINSFAAGERLPDLTILLDMDSTEALRRLPRRPADQPDRMEEEPLAFYQAVRDGYLRLAEKFPERIRTFDATQPPEATADAIWLLLTSHAVFQGLRA